MSTKITTTEKKDDGVYECEWTLAKETKISSHGECSTWIQEILADHLDAGPRASVCSLIMNKLREEGYLITDTERGYLAERE